MKVMEIYVKTLKFVWMKLGLGLLKVILSILLLAICFGLAALFNSDGALGILILVWLGGTAFLSSVLTHYIGYLVKAGHIAVVSHAVSTGQLPENQFETAKQMVTERFATSNVYFVVDKLVSGAVHQLQSTLQGVDNLLGNIPGVSALVSIAQVFVGIALGYVDECCLGYTFINKEQSAFKSAADGVVIYFQNWKRLLKDAAKMTLLVIVAVILSTLLSMLVFGGLFRLLNWNGFIAFIISLFVAFVIKTAFIDSYMMIKMMVSYLEVAPQTQITFDLYDKLSKLSKKFKELFNKGNNDSPSTAIA